MRDTLRLFHLNGDLIESMAEDIHYVLIEKKFYNGWTLPVSILSDTDL